MRRKRNQSLYASARHYSKQHCPEDLCCSPCCPCVERLTKANRILLDKNAALAREKEDYLKEIMRLNKVVKAWEKREREFKDLDEVKRRLREDIKAELEDKRRVDDMIVKQKLSSNKKEKEILQREKEELLDSLEHFSKKFQKLTNDYTNLEQKHGILQRELQAKRKQIAKNEQAIGEFKRRSGDLQNAVRDKTEVIARLQKGLNSSQQNYFIEKTKNTDHQLELIRSKQQMKAAADSIHTLKKDTEEKKLSLQELAVKNSKLDNLVHNMDSTIHSYTILQGQLRHRILASQQYAIQKELQAKQLESDFYDVLYRKSI